MKKRKSIMRITDNNEELSFELLVPLHVAFAEFMIMSESASDEELDGMSILAVGLHGIAEEMGMSERDLEGLADSFRSALGKDDLLRVTPDWR